MLVECCQVQFQVVACLNPEILGALCYTTSGSEDQELITGLYEEGSGQILLG